MVGLLNKEGGEEEEERSWEVGGFIRIVVLPCDTAQYGKQIDKQ